MPLTRKQAWRRVRVVRHEGCAGETTDGASSVAAAASYKRPAGDWIRQMTQQPQQRQQERHRSTPSAPSINSINSRTERSDSSSSSSSSDAGGTQQSPERKGLDNWRLPKDGRDPWARRGVSAAKRQAAAPCVRVGSRVSFNTVVAAVLIPSAKDLHAAAREELWWQETDYRDFRINFIQFMRTPPAAGEAPELVPVEIVAESESTQEEERAETLQDTVQQPVVVEAVLYEDAGETEKVCAWPVQTEAGEAMIPSAIIAKQSASSSSLSDSDTSPPTPPSEPGSLAQSDGGESDESVETAPSSFFTGTPTPKPPSRSPRYDEQSVRTTVTVTPEAAIADGGGCWDDQENNRRSSGSVDGGGGGGEHKGVAGSLGWSSTDDGNDADEEGEDEEVNIIRVRRAFSNQETARRSVAGRSCSVSVVAEDSSDGGDSSDDAEDDSGFDSLDRPRALSLDGWFTCGLGNESHTKSYETHDHAGRLRELVKLAPLPAVCPTPPNSDSSQEVDLNDALRRLGVTFNVTANGKGGGGGAVRRRSLDEGGIGGSFCNKCRAEGGNDGVVNGNGSLFPSSAAVAANTQSLASSTSMEKTQQQKRVGQERSDGVTRLFGFRVA